MRLQTRLEIMHQKRDTLALATFACSEAQSNVQHACHFVNSGTEVQQQSTQSLSVGNDQSSISFSLMQALRAPRLAS